MRLTRLAVYHPVILLTFVMALLLGGLAAYVTLGLEQSPKLDTPIVTVQVVMPGAGPRTVEQQVTREIEDAVAGLGNIKTLSSVSRSSLSTVVIEFHEGIDVEVAVVDVQQRVSGILRNLPAEAENPSYLKLDLNDSPVLYLGVTGPPDADETQLFRVADDLVRPRLETASGVGRVLVLGGRKPEVAVEVQPDRLRAYGLTLDEVTNAVASQFLSTAGGDVQSGSAEARRRSSLRIDSRQADLGFLGEMPVTSAAGLRTELRNVAAISLSGKEAEEVVRLDGQSAVGLQIYKQASANIVQTVDGLRPILDDLNARLPTGYAVHVAVDKSTAVRQAVAGVQEELILALIIAGLVLFLFLHSLPATIIVVIAIPLSLIAALIAMKLTGLTLNMLTLVGLTTSIGILVDDSVVVLENIHTHLERGEEPTTAAIEGRSEIGLAAIAITLVDVAVWGPILFITGITGAFLRNFSLVIVAATLASLVVSFTVTPLLASRWLSSASERSRVARIAAFWEPAYQAFARLYAIVLHWALRHRPVVILGAAGILAANVVILPRMATEFVPESNESIVMVVGELPPGTALDASDRAAKRWETAILDRERYPEVRLLYTLVGRGMQDSDRDRRFISLTLDIGESKSRTRTSREISRAVVADGQQLVPGMLAKASSAMSAIAGLDIQVRIFGDDLDQLASLAELTSARYAARPELIDVSNSMAASPELVFVPDPRRLLDLGTTTQALGSAIRTAYQGTVAGRWPDQNGRERDIRVRLPASLRNDPAAVADLPLVRRGDRSLTVSQLATIRDETTPTAINRVNRQRIALVSANTNHVPLSEGVAAVNAAMQTVAMPAGYHWAQAGSVEQQQESFGQLTISIAASVVLMFMVLAVLYENWLQPLLIQTALPLATVGALLGLLAFGQNIGIVAFIGAIALFGMVGKNSILLVDRANDLRRRGLDRTAALEQAGASRLRPILMTSAVLILSMLPVALKLGEGGETRAPIGAVLVGGMLTSTFLSLLYVPVAYTYVDSLGRLFGKLGRGSAHRRPAQEVVRAAPAEATEAPVTPPRAVLPPLPPLAPTGRPPTHPPVGTPR